MNISPSAKNKDGIPEFEAWTKESCGICFESMREIFHGSPLDINEHQNLNVIILHCGHFFHEQCFREWYKKRQECPYCRTNLKNIFNPKNNNKEMLQKYLIPRLRCRAIISKSKNSLRIGQQCECLEFPGNMGFCRKHLPLLTEITTYKDNTITYFGNRKELTKLKYWTFRNETRENKEKLIKDSHINLLIV